MNTYNMNTNNDIALEQKLMIKLVSNAMASGFTAYNLSASTLRELNEYTNKMNEYAEILIRCEYKTIMEVKELVLGAYNNGYNQAKANHANSQSIR